MKKNIVLYVLLVFLIIVNVFFLFNYMGNGNDERPNERQGRGHFITKELGFTDVQLVQFRDLSEEHHEHMMQLSDDIKELKDELFEGLTDTSINEVAIDSITTLLGEKLKAKELEVFYHFKKLQAICNTQQKEKFQSILTDALRQGDRGNRPPPSNGEEGHRPPPPNGEEGRRPPPRRD